MKPVTPELGEKPCTPPRAEATKRRGNRTTRIPEILDVAIRVFAECGDDGFTQRRIASEAGIQLGTLQHYFGSRDALLRATIEESSRRYLALAMGVVANQSKAPEQRLEAMIDHTFATFTDRHNIVSPFALECWALAEHNDWMREVMERVSETYHTLFSELVGQINPKLTVEDSWVRGAMIYSHWQGLLVFLRRSKYGQNYPQQLQDRVKMSWTALARDRP